MSLATILRTCRGRQRKLGVACVVLICVSSFWWVMPLTNYNVSRPDRFRRNVLQGWVNDLAGDVVRRSLNRNKKSSSDTGFQWFANDRASVNSDDGRYDREDDWNRGEDGEGHYDDFVSPVNSSLVKEMLYYPERKYSERVLILSPIHNVATMLPHYAKMLQSLTYPHDLISVALGEDSSTDDTMAAAKDTGKELAKHFKKVWTLHLNITGGIHGDWVAVHDRDAQLQRRSHLAVARNRLLKASLEDEDWILWVDSDVGEMPHDIIQQLLSAQKDIVVPVCLMRDEDMGGTRVYDKNTWRETAKSLQRQQSLPPETLVLEGYGPSYRIWLSELRREGRVVPLDGVGGCTLLIRADCHRKGLIFPTEIYDHHIETEGLAKMAKKMKFGVYGMPFVEVMHS